MTVHVFDCGMCDKRIESAHAVVGLMRLQSHMEEKHDISEEEFLEELEQHTTDKNQKAESQK